MTRRASPLPGEGIPQTVYALTECIQRRLSTHFAGTGLHWGLKRILQELWIADGLSQAELAKAVRSSEASASNMLKNLVRDGWVERRRDAYDYRIWRVFLTEQAKALRDAIQKECASIDAEIRETLGVASADHLRASLQASSERLSRDETETDIPGGIGIYDSPSPPGQL